MNPFEAIALGIIQGITEFLPVSSSGHLVLFQNVFNTQGEMLFFDTMLHFGTLLAVVVVFWVDIVSILRHPFQKLTGLLLVATIPAVIVGLLFQDSVESAFGGQFLGIGFLVTSIFLVMAELIAKRSTVRRGKMNYPDAMFIGCMQAVAIFPGISRSGSTLTGALSAGIDRTLGARFSFLMTIPVILGSVVLQGYDLIKSDSITIEVFPVILGTLFAAVSGFFAIRFMLNLIQKRKLYGFAVYTGLLGLLVLADQIFFNVVFVNPF